MSLTGPEYKIRVLLHPDAFQTLEAAYIAELLNLAKFFTQRQLLLRRKFLRAEKQHLEFHPGRMQFLKQGVVVECIGNLQAR